MSYKHSTIWIEEVTEIPAEIVVDWGNRNTITGQVFRRQSLMPTGFHSEPDCPADRLISSPMDF